MSVEAAPRGGEAESCCVGEAGCCGSSYKEAGNALKVLGFPRSGAREEMENVSSITVAALSSTETGTLSLPSV